jgi:hypothetical protein
MAETAPNNPMNREWYCVENNITVGPITLADLAERFGRAKGEPCLVWTEGMSDWADARTVPAISKSLQSVLHATRSDAPVSQKPTLGQRTRHELIEYIAISTYLFVCFGSLLFINQQFFAAMGSSSRYVALRS